MTALLAQSDLFASACSAAATLFLQSSLVLLAGLAAVWLLRRRGAAMRSAALRATLAGLVLTPIATMAVWAIGLPLVRITLPSPAPRDQSGNVIPLARAQRAARVIPPVLRAEHSATTVFASDNRPAPQSAANNGSSTVSPNVVPIAAFDNAAPSPASAAPSTVIIPRLCAIFTFLWIAGAGVLLARLLIANIWVAVIRRNAIGAPDSIARACARLAWKIGVKPPAVCVSRCVKSPCLVGWLRPAILLPDENAVNVDVEILLHELAHVARRDCPWQLLAKIAVALTWFQPLAWLLASQMEAAAEQACDDIVLAHGGDRAAYARRLVDLAERLGPDRILRAAVLGVMAPKSGVGRRVTRLLDVSRVAHTRVGHAARGILLTSIALTVLTAAMLRAGGPPSAPAKPPASPAESPATVPTPATKPSPALMRFAGRVLSPDGTPRRGAHVCWVSGEWFDQHVARSAVSDGDGKFALDAVALDINGQQTALVRLAGTAFHSYVLKPGGKNEIRLQPPTRVSVTLLDAAGKPAVGLRVLPSMFMSSGHPLSQGAYFFQVPVEWMTWLAQTTDAKGTVTFADLPRNGRMRLQFGDERFATPDFHDSVPLADDAMSPALTLHLAPGATVSGKATYGSTGLPAAGMRINVQGTNRSGTAGGGGGATDSKGNYRISNLQAGEYDVEFFPPDPLEDQWTAVAHEALKVGSGSKIIGIDFKLIKGAVITGKVIAADTGKPLGIPDMRVGGQGPAHPRSAGAVQSVLVGADGTFSMRVPPGEQNIFLQGPIPDNYLTREQPHQEVTVADGATAMVNFALVPRAGKPVEGIVLDADGKPVGGVRIIAQAPGCGMPQEPTCTSYTDGTFRLEGIAPGTLLRARKGDAGTLAYLTVKGGEKSVRLGIAGNVRLKVTGIAVDSAGKPIPYPRVKTMQWFGNYGYGAGSALTGGVDGKFVLDNLWVDVKYTIYVEADGYGEETTSLDLKPGASSIPPVALPRAGARVTGRVLETDHRPVKGMPVAMDTGNFIHIHYTDDQGRFTFDAVDKRNCKIMIRWDRGADFSQTYLPLRDNEFDARFPEGGGKPEEFIVPREGKMEK